MGNPVALRADGVEQNALPNAKVLLRRIEPGDAYIVRTGGGGGFESLALSEPARLADDVKQGCVSAAQTRWVRREVLDGDGAVDVEATRRARARS